jgi:hypothetical protein
MVAACPKTGRLGAIMLQTAAKSPYNAGIRVLMLQMTATANLLDLNAEFCKRLIGSWNLGISSKITARLRR